METRTIGELGAALLWLRNHFLIMISTKKERK